MFFFPLLSFSVVEGGLYRWAEWEEERSSCIRRDKRRIDLELPTRSIPSPPLAVTQSISVDGWTAEGVWASLLPPVSYFPVGFHPTALPPLSLSLSSYSFVSSRLHGDMCDYDGCGSGRKKDRERGESSSSFFFFPPSLPLTNSSYVAGVMLMMT